MVDDDMRRAVVQLYPRLRRFAIRVAGSAMEADDLVQHACERALSHGHQWEPETRLDSWLFRIIWNRWFDDLRSSRVRSSVSLDAAAAVCAEGAERLAEARITVGIVLRALEDLPADQRAVLMLVCVEELPYREVADILGIPLGTVTSRLGRARLALARRIEFGKNVSP